MNIKLVYDQHCLDLTAKFILKNNKFIKSSLDELKQSIIDMMYSLAGQKDSMITGTAGYYLVADREYEGIDFDINICTIQILADLKLSK